MTKEHRLKAMGQVLQAASGIKDDEALAQAVRKIVDELRAEEKAHRQAAAAELAAAQAMKIAAEGGSVAKPDAQ